MKCDEVCLPVVLAGPPSLPIFLLTPPLSSFPFCCLRERLAEFVESEAELSGEDIGSELEEDEEDLLNAEEREQQQKEARLVQQELLGLTDTQLRDQVNKAHM